MNIKPLVEARHLRRLYIRSGRALAAADNVNFTLEAGESVSIMGPSGSGKTTLLGLLTGLVSPTSGEIFLDGRDLRELDDAEASGLRNALIGYVPQGQSLLPSLNALDNARLPCFLANACHSGRSGDSPKERDRFWREFLYFPASLESRFAPRDDMRDAATARALELLRAVGVEHLRDALPKDMSGGEMRRVAIARALIRRPRLVVADEPTSDLDEDNAEAVMRLLAQANARGAALLVATHDRRLAGLAKRRLVMNAGKLAPA